MTKTKAADRSSKAVLPTLLLGSLTDLENRRWELISRSGGIAGCCGQSEFGAFSTLCEEFASLAWPVIHTSRACRFRTRM